MTDKRILHIGIASRESLKKRTIAIARGEFKPSHTEPRVWFSSFESLAKILSDRNMLLLETIRRGQPRSLTELARLSGRAVSNLSRTLHSMERYGLVEFKEEDQRKVPMVRYERVNLEVALDSNEHPPKAA